MPASSGNDSALASIAGISLRCPGQRLILDELDLMMADPQRVRAANAPEHLVDVLDQLAARYSLEIQRTRLLIEKFSTNADRKRSADSHSVGDLTHQNLGPRTALSFAGTNRPQPDFEIEPRRAA